MNKGSNIKNYLRITIKLRRKFVINILREAVAKKMALNPTSRERCTGRKNCDSG